MPVAIYARVSTEEQRERQSILTQLEFAERYCKLHDLPVYRVYSDDGISGTVPLERRPEGSQILRHARQGKFNQLLIYRLDRLGRETRLILNAVAELERLGVRIRSMTEEFDTGTATGRLMLTLLSGFASHERNVIRERSVAGTFRVAEAGAWLGGIVPYAYRKAGEKRDARIVVCEEPIPGVAMSEANVIREIFRMAATERKSCRAIADKLNQLRIPCAYIRDDRLVLRGKRKQKTSGLWRPGRIRGLLTNKTYMGIHEFGKRNSAGRKIVARPVPAIVSRGLEEGADNTGCELSVREEKREKSIPPPGTYQVRPVWSDLYRCSCQQPQPKRRVILQMQRRKQPWPLREDWKEVSVQGRAWRLSGAAGVGRRGRVSAGPGRRAPATAIQAGNGPEGHGRG